MASKDSENKKKKEYKTVSADTVSEMVINVKSLKVAVLEYVVQDITDTDSGEVVTEKLFHLTVNQKGYSRDGGSPTLETIRLKLTREELDKLIHGLNQSKAQVSAKA